MGRLWKRGEGLGMGEETIITEETLIAKETIEKTRTTQILEKYCRIRNEADQIATDETMRIAEECLRLEFSQVFEKRLAVWRKRFASSWTGLLLEDNARRVAGTEAWEYADKAFHLAVTENYPRLWALWYERLLAEEDEPDKVNTDDRNGREVRESDER